METRELYALIAELPRDFRDALVAIDVVGLSYAEAAKSLGVRQGTITEPAPSGPGPSRCVVVRVDGRQPPDRPRRAKKSRSASPRSVAGAAPWRYSPAIAPQSAPARSW